MPNLATPTVEHLLNGPAVTVHPEDTLAAVAELLTSNGVGAVPVVDVGRVIGVISERDIVAAFADGADPEDERVSDRMALDPVTVPAGTPAEAAARMMVDGAVRHLPVTDDDRVVGVLSMRDVLAAVIDAAD